MGIREYAAALHLSPTSLRTWRDRLDEGEVEIDWRAYRHPSAVQSFALVPAERRRNRAGRPHRRMIRVPAGNPPGASSATRKNAIALESDQLGDNVSHAARKHGIVTGMLFRWRVQFGVAQKKRAKLAPVALTDGTPAALLLRDLMQPPDGMTAIDLPDGRRVFAPAGSDPDAVREHLESEGTGR